MRLLYKDEFDETLIVTTVTDCCYDDDIYDSDCSNIAGIKSRFKTAKTEGLYLYDSNSRLSYIIPNLSKAECNSITCKLYNQGHVDLSSYNVVVRE